MKNILILLSFLICITVSSQTTSVRVSPPLSQGSPQDVGLSGNRLDKIERMLEQAVEKGEIPGGVVLIARNGKIVLHKGFGMSDAAENRTFRKDDIFRIASQTKAITATAVMMLWEEGKFRLDDPISKYIPAFENTGVLDTFNEADSSFTVNPLEQKITVRHLITHTSGIGYGIIDGDDRFRKIFTKAGIIDLFTTEPVRLEENIKKLASMPLHHPPGEKWTYSEGMDVLGYFIEIISGMPFDQFLKTRIFDPLGMKDTWFYLPENLAARLVPVQHNPNGEWSRYSSDVYDVDYPVNGAKAFFSGGAGLSSTAQDYAIFLQMYLNGGEYQGVRLLSRTTVESIMANQIGELWAGGPADYGLAFGLVNENGIAKAGAGGLGTFGWGGYFNTSYFADPQEKVIGILMKQSQGAGSDQTGWKFRQMLFASIDD